MTLYTPGAGRLADPDGGLPHPLERVVRLDNAGAGAMFEAADPSEVDGLLTLLRHRLGLAPGPARS
jgi:hypothetical protein